MKIVSRQEKLNHESKTGNKHFPTMLPDCALLQAVLGRGP